jgi:hypothetical protein
MATHCLLRYDCLMANSADCTWCCGEGGCSTYTLFEMTDLSDSTACTTLQGHSLHCGIEARGGYGARLY